MELRRLGRYGPEISVVGFGAWEAGGDAWGPNPSDEQVLAAIRAAVDAGMNWIDTAEVYGRGRSEELVGQAVAGIRDEVLIFTKVGGKDSGSGYRPEEVKRAIRASLRRLGTDYVDLYQIHWPDPSVPLEETWGAMAELVEEGLTRFIGVSNFDREQVERCLSVRHVDSVQNQFSLLKQDDRREFLPWLEERGVGYLAYAPLAFGLLTGAIRADTVFDERDWRSGKQHQGEAYRNLFAPGKREEKLALVEQLRVVADRLGVALAPLALRWVVEQRGVTAAIAGSRNPEHVRSNATAGDLKLDEDTLAEIDRIFA
ncbi:MAG TPA: aldo/keto reductase [Actinomycetota bacterium]|nr:aldo/keto reductase [Actinomycetota bacterium]